MRRTPRSLRVAAVAVAAALATVVAGCSSGPSDSDVAWADGLCGSLLTFTEALRTQPNIDTSDPDKMAQGLGAYLQTASMATQGSIDSLSKLGPSPIDGGDAVVSQYKSTLSSVKSSFDEALQKVRGANTDDPNALSAAISPLQQLSKIDTSGLNGNADINAAAAKAANCQKLQQTG